MNKNKIYASCCFAVFAGTFLFALRAIVLPIWGREFELNQTELGFINGAAIFGFGVSLLPFSLKMHKLGFKRILVYSLIGLAVAIPMTCSADIVHHFFGQKAVFAILCLSAFTIAASNGGVHGMTAPLMSELFDDAEVKLCRAHGAASISIVIACLLWLLNKNALPWECFFIIAELFVITSAVLLYKEKFPCCRVETDKNLIPTPIAALLILAHSLGPAIDATTLSWIPALTLRLTGTETTWSLIVATLTAFIARQWLLSYLRTYFSTLVILSGSAIVTSLSLLLLSRVETVYQLLFVAIGIGLGVAFFWPQTQSAIREHSGKNYVFVLGLAAFGHSIVGGLILSPLLGHSQDFHSAELLEQKSKPVFEEYIGRERKIYGTWEFQGLDVEKVNASLNEANGHLLKSVLNSGTSLSLTHFAVAPLLLLPIYLIIGLMIRKRE